jgi:hypothetical protein
MKKQLIITGIVAILITVELSGCNSSPENKIIGTWVSKINGTNRTFIFYNNGSANEFWALANIWYKYSITEDKLIIGDNDYSFTFSDNNQTLILDDVVWIRQ